jgi:hyperosmotically inducible periplasmic protein
MRDGALLVTPGNSPKEDASMAPKDTKVFPNSPAHPSMMKTRNKTLSVRLALLTLLAVGSLAGCSKSKSPDVSDSIRKSLDQANLKSVSVSQDRDKGVVTLTGNVATDSDKAQAESIAKSNAAGQVVADEIAVVPPGDAGDTKTVNSDLDGGIDKNLNAALVQNKFQHGITCKVKNGVVTLTGEVNSQAKRAQIEQIASGVPNVQQVVNELEIKNSKATTSVKR